MKKFFFLYFAPYYQHRENICDFHVSCSCFHDTIGRKTTDVQKGPHSFNDIFCLLVIDLTLSTFTTRVKQFLMSLRFTSLKLTVFHDTQIAQISQKQDEHNICYHENNVPSRLSPRWLCGNSCTWTHDGCTWVATKKLKDSYIYFIYTSIYLSFGHIA